MAERPHPQSGGHWGHTQQTGRDHSSALPCCHPGGEGRRRLPPSPHSPPARGRAGTARLYSRDPPETPGTAPGRAESRGRTRGAQPGMGVPWGSAESTPSLLPSPTLRNPKPWNGSLGVSSGKRGNSGHRRQPGARGGGIRGLDGGGGRRGAGQERGELGGSREPNTARGCRGAGGHCGGCRGGAVGLGGCGGHRGRCGGSGLSPSR